MRLRTSADAFDHFENPIGILSGKSACDEHGRIVDKKKLCARGPDQLLHGATLVPRRAHQIPFIEQNNARLPGFLNQSRDPPILPFYSLSGIDDENADICPVDCFFGAHHRENLDGTRVFAACANAGSVDENIMPAVTFILNIDGVARRSR